MNKVGVYFCNCGTNIAERIDYQTVAARLASVPEVAYISPVDFLCSEDGKQALEQDLRERRPGRVVIAACSPRDYLETFMQVMAAAGMNPYLLQMVNIREQVAWVTPDAERATAKACSLIRGAAARTLLQEPLERRELDVCRDMLVIGAGPAGLKCALMLAEAGRQVTLVEKTPALGGMPVRYEDLFPNMECGPCMLEPLLGEVLHGKYAGNIEILTLCELADVAGYYGNFTVKLRQAPRYVDVASCIGCAECIAPCPVSAANEFNYGLDERKAIAFPFLGALPNAPFLDPAACLRPKGEDCHLCRDACPIEETVLLDDQERILERQVGGIVLAVGSALYDCSRIPALAYGRLPGVYTSLEFERILASNGPTGGELRAPGGGAPESVAIIHCVGSLDAEHRPYCSGICCDYAFKFNHLVEKKLPGTRVFHLYKELAVAGKEEFSLYQHARHNPNAAFLRYGELAGVTVGEEDGRKVVHYRDVSGAVGSVAADMVVLCPAVVGPPAAQSLAALLDAPCDRFGFFEELHGRLDAAQSKMRGVYLAGACQAPMDIQKAINRGVAAAGYVLSGLAEGRKLEIEPITAAVDEERCSLCRTCGAVCPYKAISFPPGRDSSYVNALLCHGCGTCVAACPSGAIRGNHFTNEQMFAEIEAVLQ